MSVRMKYVIVPTVIGEMPIIFPEVILHKHAVDRLATRPVSAGFCEVDGGKLHVFGQSDSLNLRSRKEDHDIISDALALCGLMPGGAAPQPRSGDASSPGKCGVAPQPRSSEALPSFYET